MKKIMTPFRYAITLIAVSALVTSCGNDKPTPELKKDSAVDSSAMVKTEPPKPVIKLDPNDTSYVWIKTIKLDENAGNLAIYPDGRLVLSGSERNSVSILDSTGKLLHKFGAKGRADSLFTDWPGKTAIGPNGDVYVLDGTRPRVVVFDSTGKFRMLVKLKSGDLAGGIAVDKEGNLYHTVVTGWIIRQYDANGKYVKDLRQIKDAGGKIWGFMDDIALDSAGNMYVTNWRGMGNGVDAVMHVCGPDGSYQNTYSFDCGHTVVESTVDRAGRFYGDDESGVTVFGHDGKKIAHIGKKGKGDGCFEMESIFGMQMSDQGYFYALSNKGELIQVFH